MALLTLELAALVWPICAFNAMDSAKPAGSSEGFTIFEPEDSSASALFSSLVELSRLLADVMAAMFVFKLLITIDLTLSLSHPLRGVFPRHPCRVAEFKTGF